MPAKDAESVGVEPILRDVRTARAQLGNRFSVERSQAHPMLGDQRQAIVEMTRMSRSSLDLGPFNLGRDLEDGALDKVDGLGMEGANDGSVTAPMGEPVVGAKVDFAEGTIGGGGRGAAAVEVEIVGLE